ncbi:hypothetical protein OAH18_01640 [bacterium]|nr:hypothetical protein [bacterium]
MLLINSEGQPIDRFEPISLSKMDRSESWIQKILFDNIDLLASVHPHFENVRLVPICQEFRLPGATGKQRLDILAVTQHGQPVLIECKLWKNPEARRKVIAQVLEYAALTKDLSYSDLSAQLRVQIKCGDVDPIAQRFQEHGVDFDEPRLLDNVASSLATGNFHLVIVGDGVRAGVRRITENLDFSAIVADLTLVELPVFRNSNGEMLLAPRIPFRTETARKTVLVDAAGDLLIAEESDGEPTTSHDANDDAKRRLEGEFWDGVCAQTKFDHPEQESLKYRYPNHAKAKLPPPCGWLLVYRYVSRNQVGVQVVVRNDEQSDICEFFRNHLEGLRELIGDDLVVYRQTNKSGVEITTSFDLSNVSSEPAQAAWFAKTANKMVTALRPLLNEYSQ